MQISDSTGAAGKITRYLERSTTWEKVSFCSGYNYLTLLSYTKIVKLAFTRSVFATKNSSKCICGCVCAPQPAGKLAALSLTPWASRFSTTRAPRLSAPSTRCPGTIYRTSVPIMPVMHMTGTLEHFRRIMTVTEFRRIQLL